MNHRCKEKVRHDELRSPIGQAAYAYYSHWMKAQKHTPPTIDTFGESKFFPAFYKFATRATKVHIPNVNRFIEVMVESNKVPPVLWCRDSIYSMYLKSYDASVPPVVQFDESRAELEQLASELQVGLVDAFAAAPIDRLEDLIKKRKLSHWFLLASARFRAFLLALPAADKARLATALNADAAMVRISQEPELFAEFNAATRELGL